MLREERTSTTNCNYHLVFVTKYRKDIFTTEDRKQYIKDVILRLATNTNTEVERLDVVDDHVDLIVSFTPQYSVSSIVKSLKGSSAREWFKKYPETKELLWNGHLWASTFYCATVGGMATDTVNEYIKQQTPSKMALAKLGHAPSYTKKVSPNH